MTSGSSSDTSATVNVNLAERVARVEAITQERDQSAKQMIDAERAQRDEIVNRLDQRLEAAQHQLDRRLDDYRKLTEEVIHRVDTRFETGQSQVASALVQVDRAQDKYETQARALQVASNEWRAAMNDREKMFPTRIETDTRLTSLSDKVDAATKANADRIDTLAATTTTSVQYIERKMTEGFENLRLSRAAGEGGVKKLDDTRLWAMAFIAFLVLATSITSLIVAFTR